MGYLSVEGLDLSAELLAVMAVNLDMRGRSSETSEMPKRVPIGLVFLPRES
jgi:hypothetical protein